MGRHLHHACLFRLSLNNGCVGKSRVGYISHRFKRNAQNNGDVELLQLLAIFHTMSLRFVAARVRVRAVILLMYNLP